MLADGKTGSSGVEWWDLLGWSTNGPGGRSKVRRAVGIHVRQENREMSVLDFKEVEPIISKYDPKHFRVSLLFSWLIFDLDICRTSFLFSSLL